MYNSTFNFVFSFLLLNHHKIAFIAATSVLLFIVDITAKRILVEQQKIFLYFFPTKSKML